MMQTLGRTVAVALMALTPLAISTPAHAANFGEALKKDGTWKAYALFEDGSDRLCIRAYNSTSAATVRVTVAFASTSVVLDSVEKPGGNENRRCSIVPDRYENVSVDFYVYHFGGNGQNINQVFRNRTL